MIRYLDNLVDRIEDAKLLIKLIPTVSRIGLDTETTGLDPYTSQVLLIQLKVGEDIFILDRGKLGVKFITNIINLINQNNILCIGHNIKFDMKMIKQDTGVWLKNVYDTMIIEAVITAGLGGKYVSLLELVSKYCGVVLEKESRLEFLEQNHQSIFTERQLTYSATDVLYLLDIYDKQIGLAGLAGLAKIVELECKVEPVVARMEREGITLDIPYWIELTELAKKNAVELKGKMKDILFAALPAHKYKNAYEFANAIAIPVKTKKLTAVLESIIDPLAVMTWAKDVFNIGSHKQLLTALNLAGIDTPSTDEKVLNKLPKNEVIDTILDYRGYEKMLSTYGYNVIEAANKVTGRIHADFNQVGAASGRFSSSGGVNMQNIPTHNGYREGFIARDGYSLCACDFCLPPTTKVLKSDFSWVQIKDLSLGDVLIGLDESVETGRVYRRMKPSTVETLEPKVLPSYKVTLESGKVLFSSENHKWLTISTNIGRHVWTATKDITASNSLLKFTDTWERATDYESGYLAGMLDGEGSFNDSERGAHLTFYQVPGLVLDKTIDILNKAGIIFTGPFDHQSGYNPERTASYLSISGVAQILKIFGSINPVRLIAKSPTFWSGRSPFKSGTKDRVVSVEYVGDMEVVAMQTSARTFLADGYWTHNSQQEYRLAGAISKEPKIIEAYVDGFDMHTATAANRFMKGLEDVTKDERNKGKAINFTILYGGTEYALGKNLNIPKNEALEILEQFLNNYPMLAKFKQMAGSKIIELGYSVTMMGRRRYWKGLPAFSTPQEIVNYENRMKREGINHIIQGTGADVTKLSMLEMFDNNPFGDMFIPILQVHDEIVAEVHDSVIKEAEAFMCYSMEKAFQPFLGVIPAKVDSKLSKRWTKS